MGNSGGRDKGPAGADRPVPPSSTCGSLEDRLTAALVAAKPHTEAGIRKVVSSVLSPAAAVTGSPHPLELDEAGLRRLFEEAVDRVVRYSAELPQMPALAGVSYPDADPKSAGDSVQDLIEPEMPETGESYSKLLSLLFDRCLSQGMNTAHPGYMGHIGGGGIPHAAVADMIGDVANRQMAVWICCPGFVRLEMNVLRWFCDLAGLPRKTSLGCLTTGGSVATLSAVVAARSAKLPGDLHPLSARFYTSAHAHHCVGKAAQLVGFPTQCKRVVPTDELGCMRMDVLREMIAEDRQAGHKPFLVVPTAGTTDTGAVDDIATCADICSEEGLWMHVDAAYGFFYLLTDHGKYALQGMDRADSIVLDPHKGLGLPYGTGCLLCRDHALLEQAHNAERGAYMPPAAGTSGDEVPDLIDFTACSPELSRGFRGLRVWLPLRMYGVRPFRDKLAQNIEDARWASEQLSAIDGVEVCTEPQLSITTFRMLPADQDADLVAANAANKELLKRVNAKGDIFVTPTTLSDGRYVIRVCVNAFRTHREQVASLVRSVKVAVEQLRSSDAAE
eukprot:TRINITY_DN3715_c0_g1_i4.p1 TRINITY_DN3715_c0_g1~~TRINITY_DN3715_c0_g1_i4.p1  ORF type:complete len:560 (+),score=101.08 TRINITY_DN3715_c0_g1_i4:266-1945(+)